jgi:hypothetical protein
VPHQAGRTKLTAPALECIDLNDDFDGIKIKGDNTVAIYWIQA